MILLKCGEGTSWKIMMLNIYLKDGELTIRLKGNLVSKVFFQKHNQLLGGLK